MAHPVRTWWVATLVAGASALVAVAVAPPPAAAVTSRPSLQFANPSAQALFGAAYTKALTNLLDVNTVPYDPATYNQAGLMTNPPNTFIRAGGGYAQPWTRDASVNSWNAASLLESDVARNTLWSVVRRQADGQLIINQDNQWWDQVVWLTAAWNHSAVTGDQAFLSNAYQAATNTINARKASDYNATYGLFQGPSFFNDGIAGYPAPPADATESHGSFVGDYPSSGLMVLSTNALYYSAYRSAASMASALGRPAAEITALNSAADALKTKINQYFWIAAKGTYGYLLHNGDGAPTGQLDQSEEGTGQSFAVLFGIAGSDQARQVMQNSHIQPAGIVDVWPHFARYGDNNPGRHNVSVWPMIQGYWADAAVHAGDPARFASEAADLAGLAGTSGGFYEIYNFKSGAPDGGWQGPTSHWGPLADQTWSATAYLRMMYSSLLGMAFTPSGIGFTPTLPAGWGDVTLSGLQYRGATLSVALHGAGNVVASFKLDGTATTARSIPAGLTGAHTVDITLSEGSGGPARGLANLCLDDRQAATANGTPIQTWGCNGTAAQTWAVTGGTLRTLGKCLDVTGGGTAIGTLVQLWDCNNTAAQVWQPQPDGSLRNPQSGRCLDVPDASTAWGAQVRIWDCNGTAAQRWFLS